MENRPSLFVHEKIEVRDLEEGFQELNASDDLILEEPKNPSFDLSEYVLGVDFLQENEEEIPIRNKIKKRLERRPAGVDLVPEAENCPNSISEYLKKGGGSKNVLTSDARKHLLFLGWKIEYAIDKGMMRFYYTSPDGKQFQSLKQVCLTLIKPKSESESVSPSIVDVLPVREIKEEKDLDVHSVVFEYCPEAENCPNSIYEYLKKSGGPKNVLTSNARKHLLFLGWKIKYAIDKGMMRFHYTSPDGKQFRSLKQVCLTLMKCKSESESVSPSIVDVLPIREIKEEKDLDVHSVVSKYCPEAENCPSSISEYLRKNGGSKNVLTSNARKHLLFLGWKIKYAIDKGMTRFYYTSPDGKQFQSLKQVCLTLMKPKSKSESLSLSIVDVLPVREIKEEKDSDVHSVVSEYCPEAVVDYYLIGNYDGKERASQVRIKAMKAKQHLAAVGWKFYYKWKKDKKELRYCSPMGKVYYSLKTACRSLLDEDGNSYCNNCVSSENFGVENVEKIQRNQKIWKKKAENQNQNDGSCSSLGKKRKQFRGCLNKVLRSSKKAREVVVPSSAHHNPRTVLSLLIDNDVVLPRAKVEYRHKNGQSMAEGRISREGIKCSCCGKTFTLTKFEAHAGSTNHRPSANIFLEDGRSLFQCLSEFKSKNSKAEVCDSKIDRNDIKNDYICSVCHDGGELVLCDQCPSSFHTSCLGLKDVPDGDWFCPTCCCGLCGESRFDKDTEQFLENSVLCCDQCERQYHICCLRRNGFPNLDAYPKGNWFCNDKCERIFFGLHRILGKPIPVGVHNLTWTLLKNIKSDSSGYGGSEEAVMENYSKLNVALGVMHECFEPAKEPTTRRDLVEDVIFSRWSELNRLNFRGFYTVILERNDELITVATLRVHGEDVAEVPLVGTRFQYRRQGMCRYMMSGIEKELMELGVKRLVLPAVPSVLHTWTSCFGFSIMAESERLKFLDYSFLDFQGTVMCQKLLFDPQSFKSIEPLQEIDGGSAVSEVLQADHEQTLIDIAEAKAEDPIMMCFKRRKILSI